MPDAMRLSGPVVVLIRLNRGLIALSATVLLAGCGSAAKQPTPSTQITPAATASAKTAARQTAKVIAAPAVRPQPKASTRACATGVAVNAHASCPFAERVLAVYATATDEENGLTTLGVESPATHKTYSVGCTTGGPKLIACKTTDALVTLTFGAVEAEREKEPRQTTSEFSGMWGVQTQAENEEAGCRYGFTVSGEMPHCNTQQEGQRIQEDFQRERENPGRELENDIAGAEAQSHEECVSALSVADCP